MQDGVREFLDRRMRKVIAAILGAKERDLDPYLPEEASRAFRKAVLDNLNSYHDVCLDAVDMVDGGNVVVNEVALELMEAVRDMLDGDEPE